MNYYNEFDPGAAAWLRELIKENLIPEGDVDERSIKDVNPNDLGNYNQCHFFAGIGGWPYALRLAGWPDDKPVWTGSCPCQPFSAAGKGLGENDERHLWPEFRRLIAHSKPPTIFGEQVASKAGRVWLSRIRTDLERMGYGVGAADLCAAGISAPQIRQRLFWVANANSERWEQGYSSAAAARHWGSVIATSGNDSRLADTNGCHSHWWSGPLQVGWNCIEKEIERGGRKYRAKWRIKPGLSLLADGVPGRVAQLRGFGNAIVPELAEEFIRAYLEINL